MLDLISQQKGEGTPLQVGLWRSAIFHYAKCFGRSNARNRLDAQEIFKGLPDAMVCHDHFKNLRNKNIAHDENAYSQALPAAIINGPGDHNKIAKIVSLAVLSESLNPPDYQNLLNLVRKAIEYVEQELDVVSTRSTTELEKLSHAQLLKMDSVTYTLPGPNDVSKPRLTYY